MGYVLQQGTDPVAGTWSVITGSCGVYPLICVTGELDDWTDTTELEAHIERASEAEPYVIIDLSDVRYLESRALGALISAHRYLNERDGAFALVTPPRDVAATLARMGLSELFNVSSSLCEAVSRLNAKRS